MRKDSIASIQKNAIEFIRKCMETSGTSVDVYVCSNSDAHTMQLLIGLLIGTPTLLCIGLCDAFHVQSWRNPLIDQC